MKHKRYFPKTVAYHVCARCGEEKRPHRICMAHKEICAMREEDWLVKKAQMKESEETSG